MVLRNIIRHSWQKKRVFINKIPSTSMRHLIELLNMQPFMLSCPWMPPYNGLLNKQIYKMLSYMEGQRRRSTCPNYRALFTLGTLVIFAHCINVYMVSSRLYKPGSHTLVTDYMSLTLLIAKLIVHYLFSKKMVFLFSF